MTRRCRALGARAGLRLTWVASVLGFAAACSSPAPSLIPWPSSVKQERGTLALTPSSRIVIGRAGGAEGTDPAALDRLVPIVADELRLATGLALESGESPGADAGPGDIVLTLDTALAAEAYHLAISDRAEVTGGSYGAVAMGTTTLLQAVRRNTGGVSLPRMEITDSPESAYRGLMVDLARRWHSVETLEQLVVMCRLYKIRYLHLHLSDNQSFTFPSRAYPELATAERHYSWEELEALEAFAADRGVVLVPEIDVPGHANALVSGRPDIFGISRADENPYVVNIGKEEVYTALDRILGEVASVFSSSPFIHIGGDETWLAYLDEDPDATALMRAEGIQDVEELYRHFLVRMNEIVRSHGKQTIVWEGFRKNGEIEIPRNVLVMAWETAYQLPQDLLAGGYTLVNVSWKPLYVVRNRRWSPEKIYAWNPYRWENWYRPAPSSRPIQLQPDPRVIGGQMAAWEQTEIMEVPSLRRRLPALAERTWNPSMGRSYTDFSARLTSTDDLLQRLIRPATVHLQGVTDPGYSGPTFNREHWFRDTLTVTISPAQKDYTVHFSTDSVPATAGWTEYSAPIHLSASTGLWLRVVDGRGDAVGYAWRTDYELRPLSLEAVGLADLPETDPAALPSVFHQALTVRLSSPSRSGTIRYSLDGGAPTGGSPVYDEPISLDSSATLTARLFDADGDGVGELLRREFRRVPLIDNVTTARPVTTSQGPPENASAKLVVDGMVDRSRYWSAPTEGDGAWLMIDLGREHSLTGVDLFTYWDEQRYYQYRIEVSADGERWTGVADASDNTEPATEAGYRHAFEPTLARFLRITVLGNSANAWAHVVEIRAHER